MIKHFIYNLRLPFLDYRRYDDAKNLENHYEKFKPCLDELNKQDVSMSKFYHNQAFIHNKVTGVTHDPNTNILVDGTSEEKIQAFQSTLELTTKQVSSLNWKELQKGQLQESYNQFMNKDDIIPAYKNLSAGDVPNIWQTVSDCTDSMLYSDIATIDNLITFSKISEGSGLLVSIPMSYKIGACIGFARMAPTLGLYLNPGFTTDVLLMFKQTIGARVSYGTIIKSSKIFFHENKYVIITGGAWTIAGIAYYKGWVPYSDVYSKQQEILGLIGAFTSIGLSLKADYKLSDAVGTAGAKKVEATIKGGEGVAFTVGSSVSRLTKSFYVGLMSPWFQGANDIVREIEKKEKK